MNQVQRRRLRPTAVAGQATGPTPAVAAGLPRYPERVSLRSLPALLRNEPAMTRVIGASSATLAVSTPAQAFVLAGLVRLGSRRPVLVVTPTGAAAEQLAHDLGRLRRPDGGDRPAGSRSSRPGRPFPSSGSAPTSRPWVDGSGCCGSWAARTHGPTTGRPDIVVAPIKAVLQRLGPVPDRGPAGRGGQGGPDRRRRSWWPSWWPWATGASRSSSTEASWPCGAGSSTSSPRPPTSRSGSTCGATRSTG